MAPAAGPISAFPIGDWQFWIATAIFVIAAIWLLRPILPIPFLKRRRGGGRRQKATLTIEGKVAPPTMKKP